MTDITYKDYLAHYGVKGMQWGVRKDRDDGLRGTKTKDLNPNDPDHKEELSRRKHRNVAVVVGSAIGAAAITAGVVYASKKMNVNVDDIGKVSDTAKDFANAISKEPVGIMHAARGKHKGWAFLSLGGLGDPIAEYEASGLGSTDDPGFFKRYGKNNEKVSGRYLDPEGRKDFAGRPIKHDVILPEALAKGVNNVEEVQRVSWPMIKDIYSAMYESRNE